MYKAIVCLSGGVDSATVLAYVKRSDYDVIETVAIDYGQEHRKELEYARQLASGFSFHLMRVSIPKPNRGFVYPNRNAIILSVAAAVGGEGSDIYFGATKSDFVLFRDCRPEFFQAMGHALVLGTGIKGVYTPFINMTKDEVIGYGLRQGVPYDLTWSCYMGDDEPCMRCLACTERGKAFVAHKCDYWGKPWDQEWAVGAL